MGSPTEPRQASAESIRPRKRRWRGWLFGGLALTCCCCGGLFSWLPLTAVGLREVNRLHASLEPGMSTAELLEAVDGARLSRLGLSVVFASPRAAAGTSSGDESEQACPVGTHLTWSYDGGPPWARGSVPVFEEAAKRLSACDTIEFRLPVYFYRSRFVVRLEDGRVSEVGGLQGEWE